MQRGSRGQVHSHTIHYFRQHVDIGVWLGQHHIGDIFQFPLLSGEKQLYANYPLLYCKLSHKVGMLYQGDTASAYRAGEYLVQITGHLQGFVHRIP